MTQLLAFLSGKGGSGKTTTALAIAAVLAEGDKQVDVIDLDPQAGATDFLGLEPTEHPLTDEPVEVHGLTVFRGGRPLAFATEAQIAGHLDRAAKLGAGFLGADFLVADLSPAWTDTAHRALLARPDVTLVLAVKLDAGGLRAARELTQIAERRSLPFRIVPTFDRRTTLSVTVLTSLRAFYGSAVTASTFPEDVKAAEAAGAKQPLPLYAPKSRAALAAYTIAEELAHARRR